MYAYHYIHTYIVIYGEARRAAGAQLVIEIIFALCQKYVEKYSNRNNTCNMSEICQKYSNRNNTCNM